MKMYFLFGFIFPPCFKHFPESVRSSAFYEEERHTLLFMHARRAFLRVFNFHFIQDCVGGEYVVCTLCPPSGFLCITRKRFYVRG